MRAKRRSSTSNSDSKISTLVNLEPPAHEWPVPVKPSPPTWAPLPERSSSYWT